MDTKHQAVMKNFYLPYSSDKCVGVVCVCVYIFFLF